MGEKIKQVHFVGSFFLLFYAYSYQKYSAGHAIVEGEDVTMFSRPSLLYPDTRRKKFQDC